MIDEEGSYIYDGFIMIWRDFKIYHTLSQKISYFASWSNKFRLIVVSDKTTFQVWYIWKFFQDKKPFEDKMWN